MLGVERLEKSNGNKQLPGTQSHSSPCRSLVVWGTHAPLVHSSLLLYLENKELEYKELKIIGGV